MKVETKIKQKGTKKVLYKCEYNLYSKLVNNKIDKIDKMSRSGILAKQVALLERATKNMSTLLNALID